VVKGPPSVASSGRKGKESNKQTRPAFRSSGGRQNAPVKVDSITESLGNGYAQDLSLLDAVDEGYDIVGRKGKPVSQVASMMDYVKAASTAPIAKTIPRPKVQPASTAETEVVKVNVPTQARFERINREVNALTDEELIKSTIDLTEEEAGLRVMLSEEGSKLPTSIFRVPNCGFGGLKNLIAPLAIKTGNCAAYVRIVTEHIAEDVDTDELTEETIAFYLSWLSTKFPNSFKVIKAVKKIEDFEVEVRRLQSADPQRLRESRRVAAIQRVLAEFDSQLSEYRKRIVAELTTAQRLTAAPEGEKQTLTQLVGSFRDSPSNKGAASVDQAGSSIPGTGESGDTGKGVRELSDQSVDGRLRRNLHISVTGWVLNYVDDERWPDNYDRDYIIGYLTDICETVENADDRTSQLECFLDEFVTNDDDDEEGDDDGEEGDEGTDCNDETDDNGVNETASQEEH
jgi:hypothetical protein